MKYVHQTIPICINSTDRRLVELELAAVFGSRFHADAILSMDLEGKLNSLITIIDLISIDCVCELKYK